MATGILNVLSNTRKILQRVVDGASMLVDAAGGRSLGDEEYSIFANVLSNSLKPFVVNAEFLNLSDSLILPNDTIKRVEKSDKGFVEATDRDIGSLFEKLSSVSHLFRLPYKCCWVERDIPWGTTHDKLPGVIAYKGMFLCEFVDEEGNIGIRGSMFGYDSGEDIGHKCLVAPSEIVEFLPHKLLSDKRTDAIRVLPLCDNVSDINVMYFTKCLGVILALNSPKIVSKKTEKMITLLKGTKGNKKHVESDVVRVSVSAELRKQLNKDDDLEQEAIRKGVRAHYVRGHFKTVKTGMFWWNAHIRGVGEAKDKSYELGA